MRRETVYLRELLRSGRLPHVRCRAADGARQVDRRRADRRRPRAHAAPAGRRHHRLGQVGRRQRHDPVAALPALAGRVPLPDDRPEDAGAVGLQRHSASADARSSPIRTRRSRRSTGSSPRWRSATSAWRALSRAQHRSLQQARAQSAEPRRAPVAHRADRLRRPTPAKPSTSSRRCLPRRCPTSSSSSTSSPT